MSIDITLPCELASLPPCKAVHLATTELNGTIVHVFKVFWTNSEDVLVVNTDGEAMPGFGAGTFPPIRNVPRQRSVWIAVLGYGSGNGQVLAISRDTEADAMEAAKAYELPFIKHPFEVKI